MESSTKFTDQDTVGFLQIIYISIVSIPLFCQNLHLFIFIISHSIAQYGKEYSILPFFLYQLLQSFGRRNAHIKITVGAENNTVITIRDKILLCYFVCQQDTGTTCGRAACRQFVYRFANLLFVAARSCFQFHTCTACISHDSYFIFIT